MAAVTATAFMTGSSERILSIALPHAAGHHVDGRGRRRALAGRIFTENQHIAGFDNPGKSLYTTIRELVENSPTRPRASAPVITIEIEEMDQASSTITVAWRRGGARRREPLRGRARQGPRWPKGAPAAAAAAARASPRARTPRARAPPGAALAAAVMFYRVVCRDNGCGMAHDAIPEMPAAC